MRKYCQKPGFSQTSHRIHAHRDGDDCREQKEEDSPRESRRTRREISAVLLIPFADTIRAKTHIIFSISDPLTAFSFSVLPSMASHSSRMLQCLRFEVSRYCTIFPDARRLPALLLSPFSLRPKISSRKCFSR
jgi:hypothetical protein